MKTELEKTCIECAFGNLVPVQYEKIIYCTKRDGFFKGNETCEEFKPFEANEDSYSIKS